MVEDAASSRLDARLDRLEAKLDDSIKGIHQRLDNLTEALATIRLLEERVGRNSRSLERAFEKLEKHDDQLEDLRASQTGTRLVISQGERIFWLVVTAAVGYFFHTYGGSL